MYYIYVGRCAYNFIGVNMKLKDRFYQHLAVFSIVMLTLCVSCAKAPIEEMQNAAAAVTRAENDPNVPLYAANTLARAREALANMQSESESKRYDQARSYAQEAVTNADKAISDARAAADRARNDSATALNALRNAVSETENAISQARRSNLRLDYGTIDGEFKAAQVIAQEAENAAAQNRYRDVVERSNTARTALGAITSRIGQTSIAVTRKK
jgi:ribosome-binding protein aMBF1 (putative translation factor)